MIPFVKMHGCGNDFVVVRATDLETLETESAAQAAFARLVCDRHRGVGADGLLAYAVQPPGHLPRLGMRYWNHDGSVAEMCGNGARCVVRLAFERGETTSPLELRTAAGQHRCEVLESGGPVQSVRIQMGRVRWEADAVGLRGRGELVDAELRVGEQDLRVTALSVGNPHAVVFVPDADALQRVSLEASGRLLASHPTFLRGANASFATVTPDGFRVRVWERGAGATLACGTAACAVVAAARKLGFLQSDRAAVHLPGGDVTVELDSVGDVWLAGPAARVAEGALDPELLSPLRSPRPGA